MKITPYTQTNNIYAQNFSGIVRPQKFFQTQGSLNTKFNVFWIDVKRNYCTQDFNNNGKIKSSPLLKNTLIKKTFDFFELKLKNFHKVSQNYTRGGALSCEYDIDRLKEKRINNIISLLEIQKFNPKLAEYSEKSGIKYTNFRLSKEGLPTDEQVDDFLKICKNPQNVVYVHCLHGKDRTGLMSFIYETQVLKTPPQEAFEHMISCGMHLEKNPKMIEYLQQKGLL